MTSHTSTRLSVAILGLLVVSSLGVLVTSDQPETKIEIRSRDLESVARTMKNRTVRGRIAPLYGLAQRIPGAHLTVPKDWAGLRWHLEQVGRVDVTVADRPRSLAPEHEVLLAPRVTITHSFRPIRSLEGRRYADLYFVVEPPADRYVIVYASNGTDLFLLPEALFDALRAGTVP